LQPHGGTGLGLAIARRLSQLMRGDVGMESVAHQGSDFWCEVALQVLPAQPLMLPDMGSQTALVIDDHALAALVLERMLQEAGLRTRRVNSGAAALTLVQQEALDFDWIFVDRNMPGMDGVATLSALVQQLPVRPRHLALLNHSLTETSFSTGLPAGTEILTKPLTAKAVHQLLHAQLASELPTPTASRTLRSEGLQASAGARVLVVEDIEINREVALGLLEELDIGLIVDFADNGRLALEQLAQHDYAAIFMDMHMPELDGIAATRAIRQNPRWDGIPIIAMTANHLESDIQRCMQAGMCDFVTKPIDPQRLREAVQRWVKPATQPSSSVPAPAPVRPIVQALQSVTGLAVERGLDHFGGKQATYREMLRQFIVEHASTAPQAARACAQGDVAHAAAVLQTLISQAHAVGAELMAEHATQLLQRLQSPSTSAAVTAPDWLALERLHAQLHEQVKAAMARSFPQHHFL
ncbi:MAG: response regulator, partial [Comamonas sp.]